ncbi:MAG: T9SS type A sorting domain-containing protein [Saprospiraceae bacterium]|nr:T9SS type A sorting domain-containing protein [Saprospiraceae bacterium]
MKKYYNTLGLLILVVLGCVGQVQISDVQNLVQIDEYRKIFLSDNQRLLLAEVNKSETKVSEVTENGLLLLKIWDHEPLDQNRVYESYPFSNRPNMILKGDTLFEVFTKGLVASSVATGALLAYDEPIEKTSIIASVEEIQDKPSLLIRYIKEGRQFYGVYNYKEKKWIQYPFFNGTRMEYKIYNLQPDSITSLDLLTGQIKTEIKSGAVPLHIKSFETSNNSGIWVNVGNGSQYYIDGKMGVRQLPCLLPTEFLKMYWADSFSYYCVDKSFAIENFVIDIQNCDTLSYQLVPNLGGYYTLNLDKGERVCFAVWDNVEYRNKVSLFDPNLKKWLAVSSDFTSYYQAPQVVLPGHTYSVKIRNVEFANSVFEMFDIDANNFNTSELYFDNLSNSIISMDYHAHPLSGYLYVWTQSQYGSSNLWVAKGKGANPHLLTSFLTTKNLGFPYVDNKYVYGDKVFYTTDNAVYVTDIEGTQKLAEFVRCTPFVFSNGFLYALIQKPGQLISYIKINPVTLELKTKHVGGGFNLDNNVKPAGAVLVIGNYSNSYYFDTRTELLRKITYAGNELSVSGVVVSKNNVLYYGQYLNNRELYLWDTDKNQTLLITNLSTTYHNILPDNEGGFYLLPGNFGAGDKIRKMDINGKVIDVTVVGDRPWYYNNSEIGLEGPVHTFPFPGINEVIFHSEKQGKINVNYIPFENTLYYQSFFWKEVNETVIVETEIGGKKHTWVWKYDESPLDITPQGREDALIQAIIKGDSVLLQYHDRDVAKMQFILYNLQNGTFEVKMEIPSSYNYLAGSEFAWKDSQNLLLSLYTPESGRELWKYNIFENDLTLVRDFGSGRVDGIPSSFTPTKNNIYFLATAPDGSRQWFSIDGINSVSEPDPFEHSNFLFPNPTINAVYTKNISKQVQIFDINGRIRYTGVQLQKGERIDLTGFEPGIYMVTMLSDKGERMVSKLVVGGHW